MTPEFWSPEFFIETRADGTIVMEQTGGLPDHLPTLADYLDKWADATPDQPWLARREPAGGDWRKISYAEPARPRAGWARAYWRWGLARIVHF